MERKIKKYHYKVKMSDTEEVSTEVSPEEGSLTVLFRKQIAEQARLLGFYNACDEEENRDTMIEFAENLDFDQLKKELSEDFYNPYLLKFLACLFSLTALIPRVGKQQNLSVPAAKDVNSWYTHARRIGAESAYGIALLSSYRSLKKAVIIKIPLDPEDDYQLHEYFVAVFGTNKLRALVPNYSYILGAFKCNPPVVSGKEV